MVSDTNISRTGAAPSSVLDLALEAMSTVPPSEREVLSVIIDDPHGFAEQSMSQTARQAGVSEPTVRRASQSLGFKGFKALQRALTRELAIGLPAAFSEIDASDDVSSIVTKVLDRALSGLSKVRSELDPQRLNQAIELLADAEGVLCLGVGGSRIVALDAAQKLVILGVPVLSPVDAHVDYTTIALASPGTVVVAFSNSGESEELIALTDFALLRGLKVIAITGEAESSVFRNATVGIAAETPENSDLYAPSVSRLAALSVVDVIAAALTVRLDSLRWENFKQMKLGLLEHKTR